MKRRGGCKRLILALAASLSIVAANASEEGIAQSADTSRDGDLAEEYRQQIALDAIFVKHIVLEGNTVLDEDAVTQALATFTGRLLSFEELRLARDTVTRLYLADGYLNSGAVIADQEVRDGRVILTAVEGSLGDIHLQGNRWLRDDFLQSRLRHDLGAILRVSDVEWALRDIQDRPMIERVHGELVPGPQRGVSDLELRVVEQAPMTLSLDYNNHRAPSVGEHQGVLSFAHRSLTGRGDYLQATYALGDGVDDRGLSYGLPLTSRDLTAEIYYRRGNSDITERDFNQLDITSEIETRGLRLYAPVHRSRSHSALLGIGVEKVDTQSSLLDVPFSFSPGENAGESTVALLRATFEYSWSRAQDAISLYTAVNHGVDWFGASDAKDLTEFAGRYARDIPDSEFTTLIAQINYARQLPGSGVRGYFSVTAQGSDRPLLPSQQMVVGGARTVRGYRENQLVRDRGLVARAELQIPLFSRNSTLGALGLSVAPFVDYGIAKNHAIELPGFEQPQTDEIASAGLGIRATGWSPLRFECYYAEPLIDVNNRGDSLQERGWHLRISLNWSFPGVN